MYRGIALEISKRETVERVGRGCWLAAGAENRMVVERFGCIGGLVHETSFNSTYVSFLPEMERWTTRVECRLYTLIS